MFNHPVNCSGKKEERSMLLLGIALPVLSQKSINFFPAGLIWVQIEGKLMFGKVTVLFLFLFCRN